ncbi:MAG TPA: hypothetical protein VHZ52_12875 [Acidobacteriaceae bacterium]|jgi:hypothetical protein|nr:hypothetical protein [Acidobacteriaceae bacterium]
MSDTQKKPSPTPPPEIEDELDEANRGPNLVLLYSLLALALLAAMAFAAMVVWPFYKIR